METVQKAAIWMFVQIVAIIGLAAGAMCFMLIARLLPSAFSGICTIAVAIVGWCHRRHHLTIGKFFADACAIGYLFCFMFFLGML